MHKDPGYHQANCSENNTIILEIQCQILHSDDITEPLKYRL